MTALPTASVPDVRAAAQLDQSALWYNADKSGNVSTWGFSVDLRGGSHVQEHGSGLGTFFESQYLWETKENEVACVDTEFKIHDAKALANSTAKPPASPTTPAVPPIEWSSKGSSVRPKAPLEIGIEDLQIAAAPMADKAATRTVQGALDAIGAAHASAALRRLQIRSLPTTLPFLSLKSSPATFVGRPCFSIRHARKLNNEPAFIQQLQAQIQRGVFLLLSSVGAKQFLLEELIVLQAQTELEVIAETASLRPLFRRYLFSVDVGFQHDGVPQQVNVFADNWQYYAWHDVPQLATQDFRRQELQRANTTAERVLAQARQVNGDPRVVSTIATCILIIAPSSPSLASLSSALLALLFEHVARARGVAALSPNAATVFTQLDSARSGSVTVLRLAEYVQQPGAAMTVPDLTRLASTPYEGPLYRVAEVGEQLYFAFVPLNIILRRYQSKPTSEAERSAPLEEVSLQDYTVTPVNEHVFSLVPQNSANPTLTFTAPDRPAVRWVAMLAAVLAQHGKQRMQESIAKAVLSATFDAVYGLF